MTTEKGQSFLSKTIDLDNKRFIGCKFSNCALRYKGGQVEWDQDTSFVSCRWEFFDAAKRTIDVMNMIGGSVSNFTLSVFPFRTL
jgi:hypothetical protein